MCLAVGRAIIQPRNTMQQSMKLLDGKIASHYTVNKVSDNDLFSSIGNYVQELTLIHSDLKNIIVKSYEGGMPYTWMILDSQSTVNVISNNGILVDVREGAKTCISDALLQ